MKLLITGGAGFIGSHIVDACVEAGHSVAVVDDLSSGHRFQVHPLARFYRLDIRDEAIEEVFRQECPEIVIHEAAKANVRESMEQPILYAEVNVVGSLRLLECCRRYGVGKFIYASTGGAAYGEPSVLPVPEDHPINPLDPYGASKHHVEHYLYLYRHNYGLDFTILRYPNVYGPRQDPRGEAGVVAIFGRQMLLGQPPVINGDGEQLRDYVAVFDVVRANLLALRLGSGETFNIGSGTGTSVNRIFDLLAEATGYRGERAYGPAKPGEVQRVYLDARRAASHLGWTPLTGLEDGLRATVDSLRQSCKKELSAC